MITGIMTVMIMAPTGTVMTMIAITIMVMAGSVTSMLRRVSAGHSPSASG
ncbi:hypothetical protein ACU4GH_39375 [Bradyrhizobium betae]